MIKQARQLEQQREAEDIRLSILRQAIEQNYESIVATIRIYVARHANKLEWKLDSKTIETTAKDIFGKTIEDVLRKSDKFDPNLPPNPWILKFASNKVLQWGDKKIREKKKVISIADTSQVRRMARGQKPGQLSEEEMFGFLQTTIEAARTEQGRFSFDELLSMVQEKEREVLKLHYADGYKAKEIAALMGTTSGNIYVQLSRARKKLSKALEKEGYRGLGGEQ